MNNEEGYEYEELKGSYDGGRYAEHCRIRYLTSAHFVKSDPCGYGIISQILNIFAGMRGFKVMRGVLLF